jgi:hypothetical protein
MCVCRSTEENAMAEISQDVKIKNKVLCELLEEIRQENARRVAFPYWGNWHNWGNWRNWRNWYNWLNWLNWWT